VTHTVILPLPVRPPPPLRWTRLGRDRDRSLTDSDGTARRRDNPATRGQNVTTDGRDQPKPVLLVSAVAESGAVKFSYGLNRNYGPAETDGSLTAVTVTKTETDQRITKHVH